MSGTGFVGRYDHLLDGAGRVSLPSAFRREAATDRFFLMQVEGPCLTLYTEERWGELREELKEYRRKDADNRRQVRRILQHATTVSPDKHGRILLPQALRDRAGLADKVVIVGNLDCVELWNPDRYDAEVGGEDSPIPEIGMEIFG